MFKRSHEANVVASVPPAKLREIVRRLPPYDTLENRYANLRANPSNLGLHSPLHNFLHRFTRSPPPSSPRSTFSPEGEAFFSPPILREECERRAKGYKAGFEGSVFLRPRLRRRGFVEVKKVANLSPQREGSSRVEFVFFSPFLLF